FFSSRRRHTISKRDWSSDVCSSDLKITGTTDFMDRFAKAEEKLKAEGYAVLNPAHANSYMPEDTTWDEYMKVSLTLLQMADAIRSEERRVGKEGRNRGLPDYVTRKT